MSEVEISVTNTRATVQTYNVSALARVDEELSVFSKVAPYQRTYKLYRKDKQAGRLHLRGWDGWLHLFNKTDSSFPAGLEARIVKALSRKQPVRRLDQRIRPEMHPKLKGGFLLGNPREWQEDAFEVSQKYERGVFSACTGSGKTTLIAHIVATLGQPSLVIVPRNTLAKQTLQRFEETIRFPNADHPFGIIGDGIWEPGLITIATWQTLAAMQRDDPKGLAKWLKQFKALHLDEAHHASAKTMRALTDHSEEAYFRYGYSATPFKSDKESELWLVGACGEIIYDYGIEAATRDKVVSPARIYVVKAGFPKLPNHDSVDGTYLGKFHEEYKAGIVEHRERNFLMANLANICAEKGLPTLMLVRQKNQGQALLRLVDDGEFVNGSSSTEQREDAKLRLTKSKLPVLIASTIFDEGEDIPAVGALCLAGGYRAAHLVIQQVGRSLRPSPGQDFVLVFDSYDKHGYRLEKHSKERIKAWRAAGFDVRVVTLDELEDLMDQDGFFR